MQRRASARRQHSRELPRQLVRTSTRALAAGLGAALLGAAAPSAAQSPSPPPLPLPAPGDAAWQSVTFPSIERHTSWEAIEADGERYWRASSECSASGLALAIDPPIPLSDFDFADSSQSGGEQPGGEQLGGEQPGGEQLGGEPLGAAPGDPPHELVLHWRWKLEERIPLQIDERTKPGDDFAARVSALFAFDSANASFFERAQRRIAQQLYGVDLPGNSLGYVWARALARGTAWPSPYGVRGKFLALRGPADEDGWHQERVELIADHLARYGENPQALVGIALMTDTDNGCTRARALYGGFALERIPASPSGAPGAPAGTPRKQGPSS